MRAPSAASPPTKSTTSLGSTGMMMPIASMSSSTVTKTKAKAARRRVREASFVISSPRESALAGFMPRTKSSQYIIEETWRQKPVGIARRTPRHLTQIVAWPHKSVAFADHHPRALIVEAKLMLDDLWNFDSGSRVVRHAVGDWQDGHDGGTVACALDREHDYARTILAPFLLTAAMLMVPQIGIGNDKARLRLRKRHAPLLLGIEQFVEVVVTRVHAG